MIKIVIETHSGKTLEADVESFDASQFNQDLNDPDINTIEIGGVVRSRIDIKGVTPAEIYYQEKV